MAKWSQSRIELGGTPPNLKKWHLEAIWIETKFRQPMFHFKDFIFEKESLEGEKC